MATKRYKRDFKELEQRRRKGMRLLSCSGADKDGQRVPRSRGDESLGASTQRMAQNARAGRIGENVRLLFNIDEGFAPMHYRTADLNEHRKHGMRHDPFKAIVTPRPIGWIGTLSGNGEPNLAPYSFFNAVNQAPPMVMFSSTGRKDSLRNVEQTGEFTCSLATRELAEAMNLSSATVAGGVDEFALTGLAPAASLVIKPPRVAASPAALECRLWKTMELPCAPGADLCTLVFGEVVAIYIDERFVKDGIVDTAAMQPLARLGYMEYSFVSAQTVFSLNRPQVSADGRSARAADSPWDGRYR